jgi:PEP-CTERM motif
MKPRLRLKVASARAFLFGVVLTAALPAVAQRITIGPFVDFTGAATAGASPPHVTKTAIDVVMTHYYFNFNTGIPPIPTVIQSLAPIQPITSCDPATFTPDRLHFCGSWRFLDSININNLSNSAAPIPVKGISYFSYDTSDTTGIVRIATLYGLDLNPTGTQLSVGGIEPGGALLEFSNEKIFGLAGTAHDPFFASRVKLSQLGSVLGANFDISSIHGSANSTVQVFQTDVLVSEIAAVPEPATYALFACGLFAVGLMQRRRSIANDRQS